MKRMMDLVPASTAANRSGVVGRTVTIGDACVIEDPPWCFEFNATRHFFEADYTDLLTIGGTPRGCERSSHLHPFGRLRTRPDLKIRISLDWALSLRGTDWHHVWGT